MLTHSHHLLWALALTRAATLVAAPVDYTRQVQPILAEHCFHCHGTDEKDRKGDLRLDDRDAALKGGESDGPSILPGQPDKSPIIARIQAHDESEIMPPPKAKNPVNAEQIALLKQWIAEGAKYAKHWAFEPPAKPPFTGSHPVDAFVQAKLAELQLKPAPAAEPNLLCRRLYLDLIGLPPSPQEVEDFVKAYQANASTAVTALVTRLMKLPDYGEKWARHWLDVARYSDSNGYEKDLPRDQWAWRDWVIQAFNSDMPYDQFVSTQLAGDLAEKKSQDQVIATGFLRNSMINEEGAIIPEQFRMDEMFDRMDCIGKATLGLSLQCAQCHSHKFDPISHDEYFGIFAFFNNSYEAQSSIYSKEQQKQIAKIRQAIKVQEDALHKQHPQWQQEMADWEKKIMAEDAKTPWKIMQPTEMDSVSGLNHPTREPDDSVLTLGHPTTNGDIFIIGEPEIKNLTGLRLEALTHKELPFSGPGRSKYGTWAISELTLSYQLANTEKWEKVPLHQASTDFEESVRSMEPEWESEADPKQERVCGPVSYMIDGDQKTAFRADRGPGLRNQESVTVVSLKTPLTLPQRTRLRLSIEMRHGGGRNDRFNVLLGCCRLSLTSAAEPKAQPIDYRAIMAIRKAPKERSKEDQKDIFTAWSKTLQDEPSKKAVTAIINQWKKFPNSETTILHLAERSTKQNRATRLLDRGSWETPKHEVKPHTPAALHPPDANWPKDRRGFAQWITDKRSPLTARVAVNRVWQCLFGQGLVETSEDFGTRAPVPEYLDILDWLAVDFMEHGWSHKHLITTILTSSTYQQSSHANKKLLELDPKNRLLTRGPRFRLESEPIRDTALTAAGLLHKKVGGPSIYPPVPESVLDYNFFKPTYWSPPEGPERYRRSLYLFRKRSMPDPVMSAFDAPNGDASCARRVRSNTPLSALTGLNETVFVEAAQAMAVRVVKEAADDETARIRYAYQLCMSRAPTEKETTTVLNLLREQQQRLAKGELNAGKIAFNKMSNPADLPANATPNQLAAWTLVCRVLLNLDETLTKS
jgi:mono/diheme cytochrome c family protein